MSLRAGVGRVAVAAAVAVIAAIAVPAVGPGLVGAAPPGGAAPAGPAGAAARGGLGWVTLVTGDRVLAPARGVGAGPLHVLPGPGRRGMAFRQYRQGADTMVVPADAVGLVQSGRVDRRLFAVNRLVEFGYDDRSRTDLPLIVSYGGAASGRAATRARLASAGAGVSRELTSVGAVAVRQDKRDAGKLWATVRGAPAAGRAGTLAAGVSRVWLDGRVRPALDVSVPQIGAPAAWRRGFTGRGTTVAVLDSGVDATHPDLADAVAAARDFTDSPSGTRDVLGHGTHVASTITGNGAASGGKRVGVAPDARLLVGKVLHDSGFGSDSMVIAGMEWAAAEHADVVNMSLGSLATDGLDPVEEALNRLTAETGTLFVVAAGNGGGSDFEVETKVGSPATAEAALAVGAVDSADELAGFSSRGVFGDDSTIKPDITAPGVGIAAALAEGSGLPPVDGRYTRLSGTSMATPHVAGAAAILAGQHPDWTPAQLTAALTASAKPGRGTVFEQGAGRVDVARAVTQTVHTEPATVSHGVARWPHADDRPVTSTVSYANTGRAPVTLDLSVELRDPAGHAAPAGFATVTPARITLPPGGRAPVAVTTDTAISGPDGRYGGALVARRAGWVGGPVARTPLGVVREVESYDVAVSFIDHNGAPTGEYSLALIDVDAPLWTDYRSYDESGRTTVRVPKGAYYLLSTVSTFRGGDDPFHQWLNLDAVEPNLVVDRNRQLTIDARQGRQPGVTADRAGAAVGQAIMAWQLNVAAAGSMRSYLIAFDFEGVTVRPSQTATAHGEFQFVAGAKLARPDGAGGFTGSPYLYNVHWTQANRVPANVVRPVRTGDLAVVRARHAAPAPGKTAVKSDVVPLALPAELTEYYTEGWPLGASLLQFDANGEAEALNLAEVRTYRRGEHRVENWNFAATGQGFVVGPSLASWPDFPRVTRDAEFIVVFNDQLFSDSDPTHYGDSVFDSGSIRFLRDGVEVGRSDYPVLAGVRAAPEPATYRIESTANRSGVSDLSTRVEAAWTFRSARPTGDIPDLGVALPVMAVRFAPEVDATNTAPAGRQFPVPLSVQRQKGAEYGTLTAVAVEVSYDDGGTWRPAPLAGSGDRRVATVTHPARDGFVSLRATAADSDGNQVEQTIIRAYRIRA